jgi:DNA-binding response OmpR family regulator
MPKVVGMEFYNRIRKPDGSLKYSVLILTARGHLKELFNEFPVDGFMSKPFEMSQFLLEVKTILARREHHEKASEQPAKIARILVVEDLPELCNGIAHTFAAGGYEVDILWKTSLIPEWINNHRPDLILMKLWLPDWEDSIYRLRSKSATADIPIILYTYPEDRELDYRLREAEKANLPETSLLKRALKTDDSALLFKEAEALLRDRGPASIDTSVRQ